MRPIPPRLATPSRAINLLDTTVLNRDLNGPLANLRGDAGRR